MVTLRPGWLAKDRGPPFVASGWYRYDEVCGSSDSSEARRRSQNRRRESPSTRPRHHLPSLASHSRHGASPIGRESPKGKRLVRT